MIIPYLWLTTRRNQIIVCKWLQREACCRRAESCHCVRDIGTDRERLCEYCRVGTFADEGQLNFVGTCWDTDIIRRSPERETTHRFGTIDENIGCSYVWGSVNDAYKCCAIGISRRCRYTH